MIVYLSIELAQQHPNSGEWFPRLHHVTSVLDQNLQKRLMDVLNTLNCKQMADYAFCFVCLSVCVSVCQQDIFKTNL